MDNTSSQNNSGASYGKARKYSIIIIVLIFVFGTLRALSGQYGSVTAQVDEEKLGVLGSSEDAVFVFLDDITQVQLVDELTIGTAVDAEETKNTMCGQYENEAYGTYTLLIYTKERPCIVVTYGDGETLVFNQQTERQTKNIYEDLTES